MRPKLPSSPRTSADITHIAVSWVCQLILCLKYAMEHPKPDNRTCRLNSAGELQVIYPNQSRAPRAGGGGVDILTCTIGAVITTDNGRTIYAITTLVGGSYAQSALEVPTSFGADPLTGRSDKVYDTGTTYLDGETAKKVYALTSNPYL